MAEFNETISISKDKLTDNRIDVISLMMACCLSPGGATARRVIRGGAVFINGDRITDESHMITKEMLRDGVEIRVGKKVCVKAVLDE